MWLDKGPHHIGVWGVIRKLDLEEESIIEKKKGKDEGVPTEERGGEKRFFCVWAWGQHREFAPASPLRTSEKLHNTLNTSP